MVCEWAREAWVARPQGDHLRGIHDETWVKVLDPDHLDYLRGVAREGVPARYRGTPRGRMRCKPHASAMEHLDEIMELVWKMPDTVAR